MTFPLKQLTLRKITTDDSVTYVSKDNIPQNGYLSHDTKPKTASIPQKQIKNFQKNNWKIIKGHITGKDWEYLNE